MYVFETGMMKDRIDGWAIVSPDGWMNADVVLGVEHFAILPRELEPFP